MRRVAKQQPLADTLVQWALAQPALRSLGEAGLAETRTAQHRLHIGVARQHPDACRFVEIRLAVTHGRVCGIGILYEVAAEQIQSRSGGCRLDEHRLRLGRAGPYVYWVTVYLIELWNRHSVELRLLADPVGGLPARVQPELGQDVLNVQ